MRAIRVVPVGAADRRLLGAVCNALAQTYATRCNVHDAPLDHAFAHHPERNQYHSTQILETLAREHGTMEVIVGVTPSDLFIPILTFVFGEAQLGGSCAVVSSHRLHEEFYGLPSNGALTVQRLCKVAIHEVGHTFGLTHCDDYQCVMAAAHAVEWIDLKGAELCGECRAMAGLMRSTNRQAV